MQVRDWGREPPYLPNAKSQFSAIQACVLLASLNQSKMSFMNNPPDGKMFTYHKNVDQIYLKSKL